MDRVFTDNQEEIVEYGLEKIDANETVEVNLKDLTYVYRTLQEYMRFFHQPAHYQNLSDIHNFLGTADKPAGFHILNESVYEKMRDMFPEHIDNMFGEGDFDCPKLPSYYNENR
ncbi:hypothetical protein [Pseudoalteromonas sp. P1-25]|uniref:hypothetical protein n=1 Tax=Pseudoalteromonas sp. P1-25 TaxID=1723758 RepID=UPI0006D652F7|nr:hypothetical protein [Pseudoalteromonas sp. P1-25]KPZ52645.1 hypothetical protein AN393_03248 [Pseudoalteromonas sp. P1-25]